MAEQPAKTELHPAGGGGAGLLDRRLTCVVVTPENTVLDQEADFIALPLYDGEIGIARGHSPLIGRLGYGEMRIRNGTQTVSYYIDGGFVQVVANQVSVLTNRAVLATQIDAQMAGEHLAEAQSRPATSPESFAMRDRLEAQARAQLRVARQAH